MISRCVDWLRSPGWPGHLIALLAGALSTLSLNPFNLWPLGLVSAALLYQGLKRVNGAQATLRGWAWGLGLFATGVSWVYVSIHVHGYAPPALAGLLTALFVAGLALIPGLMAWIWSRWLRPDSGVWLASIGFSLLWIATEMFRGWFLTGFPWLYHGYAHTDTWLAGWAPIGGVWLVGLVSVLSACLLSETRTWTTLRPAALAGISLAAIWLGGWLLTAVDWTSPAGEPLTVALIQADIAQSRKWDPEHIDHTLATYRDMSYAQGPVDLIVWPETAVPVLQSQALPFVRGMASNLAEQGTTLITGIPVDQGQGEQMRIYNGIVVAGDEDNQYLKHKLVPFGEYVPLEQWLRGVIAFFDLPMSSFSRGAAEQPPLNAMGHELAPFICYEAVYPDFAARLAGQSQLLISISNDSWFGKSIGPLQHLQMARMRSIESARWMIRGTNNGVTALIDHKGELRAQIPQFEAQALKGQVQPMEGQTPFLLWRSWPLGLLMGGGLLLCLLRRRAV
ncbi:apolipoprotein N-acyltransferase [Pseudomonas saliphila]|uniref:apolipoprotein N-acyltransferase n=1 Tax=Pseudomonas saliphila TaxID=2586906 RepID=UPI001F255CAB|nr:apolipoprotein N-acyltransferase [Pseudomonas saliphila]